MAKRRGSGTVAVAGGSRGKKTSSELAEGEAVDVAGKVLTVMAILGGSGSDLLRS